MENNKLQIHPKKSKLCLLHPLIKLRIYESGYRYIDFFHIATA